MTVESALLSRGLDEMLAEARAVRDAAFGNRVTFSPRVPIALSEGSRDSSAHCTSAQPQPRAASAYLGRRPRSWGRLATRRMTGASPASTSTKTPPIVAARPQVSAGLDP